MFSIDDLKQKMDVVKYNSSNLKRINKNLKEYLNDIKDVNIEDEINLYIEKIVKIIKDEKGWKFNSWNIPNKIKKQNTNHGWNKTFAVDFIRICKKIVEADNFEKVKEAICEKLQNIDNREAGISAYSISAILHCIVPTYIPILSNKTYADIYDFCYQFNSNCNKETPSNEHLINSFTKNIDIIYRFTNENGLGNNFTLIDEAALTLDKEAYGVDESGKTAETGISDEISVCDEYDATDEISQDDESKQYKIFFNDYFIDNPEISDDDENYYLNDEDDFSVCREERQFALFLYHSLFDMIDVIKFREPESYKRIRTSCGLTDNDVIKSVFYEASFMRDFLYRDRKKRKLSKKAIYTFNKRLFEFTKIVFKDDLKHLLNDEEINSGVFDIIDDDLNYGSSSEKTKCLPEAVKYFVRAMMNSKPDLCVIYENAEDKKLHLRFIECKYKSGEGYIKLIKNSEKVTDKEKQELVKGNSYILLQTVIQYYISKFICENLLNKNIVHDLPILLKFGNKTTSKNNEVNKWYFIPKYMKDEMNSNDSQEKYLTKIKENSLNISDVVPLKMRELNLFKK